MELRSTDIGLISSDNLYWLYKKGILTYNGHISGKMTKFDGKYIYFYSLLRALLDDVKSKMPTLPQGYFSDINMQIDALRTGKIEFNYKVEGRDFVYQFKYPKVEEIERSAFPILEQLSWGVN